MAKNPKNLVTAMRMSCRLLLTGAFIALGSLNASAAEVPAGVYRQTAVGEGPGDCPTCTITITKISPHLIQVVSNNDWIGYAVYSQSNDNYEGAWEWKTGTGGEYAGKVFKVEFVYERGNGSGAATLNMTAKSDKLTIRAVYRRQN